MKRIAAIALAGTVALLAACGQPNPELAAIEAEMNSTLQRMAAMGATPERMAAYRDEMIDRAQEISLRQLSEGQASATGEPTEAEMRAVFERELGGIEDRAANLSDQCNNVSSTNDPMVGLACIAGMASQSSYAQVDITSFRKIACEKSSKPGWNCDYIIGISAAALNAFGGGGSEAQSKRFVKTDGQWIAFDY
jgi:hypothetical protein